MYKESTSLCWKVTNQVDRRIPTLFPSSSRSATQGSSPPTSSSYSPPLLAFLVWTVIQLKTKVQSSEPDREVQFSVSHNLTKLPKRVYEVCNQCSCPLLQLLLFDIPTFTLATVQRLPGTNSLCLEPEVNFCWAFTASQILQPHVRLPISGSFRGRISQQLKPI